MKEPEVVVEELSDFVTLHKDEYYEMIQKVKWLHSLEAAGVDNWEGIDFAHELFKRIKEWR